MKRKAFAILSSITLLGVSCVSTSVQLAPKAGLEKEVCLKINEGDSESRTLVREFKPLERYVFDAEGREILYEDLSGGEFFDDISESQWQAKLRGKKNDKKRTFSYGKNGCLTYSFRDDGKETTELVREYGSNGRIVHAKGGLVDLPGLFENTDYSGLEDEFSEAWFDKNGRLLRLVSLDEEETWFEYDKSGRLVHEKNSEGFEQTKKYDKNRLVYSCSRMPSSCIPEDRWFDFDAKEEIFWTYSADGRLLEKKEVVSEYSDLCFEEFCNTFTNLTRLEYDDAGRLSRILKTETSTEEDDVFLQSESTFSYSQDGRTVTLRKEDHYFKDADFTDLLYTEWKESVTECDEENRPLHIVTRGHELEDFDDTDSFADYEEEEWLSYEADGSIHWKNGKGEEKITLADGSPVFVKENYFENEWSIEKFDSRGKSVYHKWYKTNEEGIEDLGGEYFGDFDDDGRETYYKWVDYKDKRHPLHETWYEHNADGKLLVKKDYKIDYVDPVTNLYSPKKTETTVVDKYKYDLHGNITSAVSFTNGEKDRYTHKASYRYDDEGRIVYEFFGNYTEDELNENSEGWYDFDQNGFLVHKKVKGYNDDGVFATYKPEKVPTREYFFANEYTYHKNGKVKECLRYYYKNEFYERDWQPDMLRLGAESCRFLLN